MTTETTTVTTPEPIVTVPSVTVIPSRTLDNSDTRKTQALFFLAGGGLVMTLYAGIAMYLIQANPRYIYYLGLFAMLNIFVIFTGLASMLVKRTLNISKTGLLVEDYNGSRDQQS